MDDSHQQRPPLLDMTYDELYTRIRRAKGRPGRWTMPGRLVVPAFFYVSRNVNLITLVCARCSCAFMVMLPEFLEVSPYRTRPCPYCFKVGAIPDVLYN